MEDEEMMDATGQDSRQSRHSVPGNGHRPHNRGFPVYTRDVDSNSLLGQFSFAPATQTTVVTTTTTTTTKFPPLLLRPPRRMQELDLKQYPLAATPTPSYLRQINFEIGGKRTVFREAEDTTVALEQLEVEQRTLRNANGTIQTIEAFEPWTEIPDDGSASTFVQIRAPNRPASPESIPDNEEQPPLPAPALTSSRPGSSMGPGERMTADVPRPHIHDIQGSHPVTPETLNRPPKMNRRRIPLSTINPSRSTSTLLPSPSVDQRSTFPNSRPRASPELTSLNEDEPSSSVNGTAVNRISRRGSSQESAVPTPPIDEEAEPNPVRPLSRRALSSVPSRLHVAGSPSAHDGSLPSPSLSPVRAAASLQHSGYFAGVDTNSEMASQHQIASRVPITEGRQSNPFQSLQVTDTKPRANSRQSAPFLSGSVTDLPAMLDYFEAIPDELKSYVMHQLLRRCPKSTLQIVADAVNPALKCDFLTILPPELALNVLKYLDLKSLCKASQVSKKWRQMINGDERAWKELFDADGYTLAEGELQKAISEGWGWQDPYGPYGYEANLNYSNAPKSETEANTSPSTPPSQNRFSGILRRSKRKAATMLSSRNKQVKRKSLSRDSSLDVTSVDWMQRVSTAEGPYNAANAAMLAVPHPSVSLPSLKGLHLYKSLYRRHHLIRRNWMFEDTKPQHLAFRAHDTHVVTCLQFDNDKILTGSDDNNINVYETRTGILRAILTGHEGGVWALQYEGNTLVSGSTDRSVRVWNIQDARETQVFRGHTSTVRCLQIVTPVKVGENAEGKPIMMPKQPLIITGSRDSTLRVWKLPRPGDPEFIQAENDNDADNCPYFVRTLTGHQHSVRAIAAHADTLVSGSYDCTVRVWKISTGETIHRLQGHTQKVYSVVLDHARNRCISGSMDYMVRIWDLNTGSLKYTLEGHTSLVGLLDLNCDKLVSAAADSTLRIWDPENGQCKATLSAHTGAITCFKHDGQKVISGSDRTLKLWNIRTGECIKDLLSDLSGVWQVKFDERRCVAAVQRDGLTYIEVLDYGAARDGVPEHNLGRRIIVDADGFEAEANNDDGDILELDDRTDV
ncbi:F-box and WD-40 domain-containing protein CDC4 [Capronia epimyces CBS 606.96]|uniref:Probable E3 ubiquitin ligase complex SCF subunit sconB n=1 Tax=Capronia epimyces CBS 606.96 TaxID=1182542 RepID=W9XQI9_9EURO|nr:F-box and WD-40 domain-containing protein CDC4 [Capronia epimyces CBS 606.96]EXJ82468.1 F-box and WD-40 domain-containing protein CDC4 [Capronia epimyces CBS 606.96]